VWLRLLQTRENIIMDGIASVVLEPTCLARHQASESRIDRANDDIKSLALAHEKLNGVVQAQLIKMAGLFGGITVLVNMIFLVAQLYLAKH
jgi:hypothetical protein